MRLNTLLSVCYLQQGQPGEIQMLETDFSLRQQDKMETYLQHRGSIPALLSAITLELFNQQTLQLSACP
jgi:hypothetical protein